MFFSHLLSVVVPSHILHADKTDLSCVEDSLELHGRQFDAITNLSDGGSAPWRE
jgi:hypothetical protein